ncbi:MAG: sel1 repeat family protein [Prevotellaceae bacterium]|jgi:TPR repeat protein|nr:sel1 repeat family protein [Prevotellaceae bacterium]
MAFKDQYQKLVTEKKQNFAALSGEAVELINNLALSDKWFEAMAVCEAALDAGKLDENILLLRKEMFLHGKELHSGITLDDEDYADWFAQIVNFNKKLANVGVVEAWVELSSLYDNARFPHRDYSKSEEYMLKGLDLDDPLALSLYGYHLYFGTSFAKVDKIKGKELMLKAKGRNFARADVYLLLSEFELDIDPAIYEQKIKDFNSNSGIVNQLWYLLGDVYYEKFNDTEKAIEAYNKGIELIDDPYCKYKKALAILSYEIEGDKDEALLMMENAYEWNIVCAADFLGQYYYFSDDYDVEKAIKWCEKAISYYNTNAMLTLSVIYRLNDEYRDIEKGLKYLNMAVENGNIRALGEKAHYLLDIDELPSSDEKNYNISLAKELLEKAYEAGDGYAAYRLGFGYQNAEFSEECDYERAFQYYLVGAERDHLYAIELLGRYYKAGIVGVPNPEKTIEYYQKAIERGSNYAKVELAICYEEGFGVEQNDNKALELLTLAADEGYAYAHTKLGYYYMNGVVVETDLKKAFEHFSKAAENGNFDAMYNLGRIYKYSIGRPENPELALEYFEKAAKGGDLDANIEMGISYEHEYGGLEFDETKLIEYMLYAAERGHPFAQYKLGVYYYFGTVEEDTEKGLSYLKQAYENGSPYAAAVLGDHFMYSRGETSDYNDAFQYYKYAADKNYATDGIGLCYQFGLGVERSDSEAFKYFMIAADKGQTNAKYRLGTCYKYGIGTAKNLTEAYKWLLQAAEEGNRHAEYEVAMLLIEGEGISMNLEKGIKWLRKASENEQNEAQLELGNCYLTGRGVEEDEIQAMYWYQKAAENGNEKAQRITGNRNKKQR